MDFYIGLYVFYDNLCKIYWKLWSEGLITQKYTVQKFNVLFNQYGKFKILGCLSLSMNNVKTLTSYIYFVHT